MMSIRRTARALTLCLALAGAAAVGQPVGADAAAGIEIARVPDEVRIPGQYLVTLRDGSDVTALLAERQMAPLHVYDEVFPGFAGRLDADQVEALRGDPRVVSISEDQVVQVASQQFQPPWHLDRIDQRSAIGPFNSGSYVYNYNGTGAGVRVYVVDTGIYDDHAQFGARALNMKNVVGDGQWDCHGHGTHVAGIVGGTTYGVAKNALLRGVKVFNCNGGGSASSIVAGLNWVKGGAIQPAVANLSGATSFPSLEVDAAARSLVSAGIPLTVAAGNDSHDACQHSPGRAASVLTVAASDSADATYAKTNHGPCVDVFAPGVGVLSAWPTSPIAAIHLTGTSMAAPVAAGVAAIYKEQFPTADAYTVQNQLITNASLGKLSLPAHMAPLTYNRLLYKPSSW